MDIFGNDRKMRGCFTAITYGAHFQGFHMNFPGGGFSASTPPVITGVSFVEAEKFLLVPCFNNITHTYGFGHDASRSVIGVEFLGFLINKGGSNQSNIISSVAQTYGKNRLSISKQQVGLYCGPGTPLNGFLVNLESSTASQETNIQAFRMQLLMVEPQCSSARGG